MKKLPTTRVLAFLLVAFMVSFCSKTELGDSPTTSQQTNIPGMLRISFDAESLKFQEISDGTEATELERISAAPRADRQKIDIDIYEDGTSAWVMEKQEPKHDVAEHHLTPVDSTIKETQTTKIDRSGMASYYDNKGSLIRQNSLKIPSFSALVNEIKKDPNAAFGVVGLPSAERLKKLLTSSLANGGSVQDLGNGLTSIRTPHEAASQFNVAAKTSGAASYHSVDIIDTNLNLVVGSTLYDAKEEVVSKTYYAYTFEENVAKPNAVYGEIWNTDKNGNKVKSVSNTYFYQFSATVNN